MAFVLAQHGGGVSLVDDEDAVEEFAADAADEAFGNRVGPRRQLHLIAMIGTVVCG
jgi:hypothetical protein